MPFGFSAGLKSLPTPDGNCHVDAVRLGGNIHHLAAALCDRLHVNIRETLALQEFNRCGIQLLDGEGHLEAEELGRLVQALIVFGEFEHLAPSVAFAPCLLIVVPITFYPQTQGEIARCVGDLSGGL